MRDNTDYVRKIVLFLSLIEEGNSTTNTLLLVNDAHWPQQPKSGRPVFTLFSLLGFFAIT